MGAADRRALSDLGAGWGGSQIVPQGPQPDISEGSPCALGHKIARDAASACVRAGASLIPEREARESVMMSQDDPRLLVSTAWLAAHLDDPDLRILDATWFMPGTPRDPQEEYAAKHIPGAVFFDIDAVSDHASLNPHMAPAPADFASAIGALGIGDGDQVVVYDSHGIMSAPRVWWTFRLMGFDRVAVLDGGLPKWEAEGRPLAHAPVTPAPATATATLQPALVNDVQDVLEIIASGSRQIVDARGAPRFTGAAAEPRVGLRSGHMPGARNVPFNTLIAADGTLLPPDELRAVFAAAGVDPARPVTTTCGSGITAAVISLALARVGAENVALYDGSWAEWGAAEDLPIAQGSA